MGQSEDASVCESVETLTDRSLPYVTSYSMYPTILDVCAFAGVKLEDRQLTLLLTVMCSRVMC